MQEYVPPCEYVSEDHFDHTLMGARGLPVEVSLSRLSTVKGVYSKRNWLVNFAGHKT